MDLRDQNFYGTISVIQSAHWLEMAASAYAWRLMAEAASGEGSALFGISSNTEEEEGVGLFSLADRIAEAGEWTEGAGVAAEEIARQLGDATDSSIRAYWSSAELLESYNGIGEVPENGRISYEDISGQAQSARKQELLTQAEALQDELSEEFARIVGSEVPTAPDGGGGGGGGVFGGGGGTGGAAPVGAAAGAAPSFEAANGAMIGPGQFPHSSVAGPEQGDFAGWVTNPHNGFLTDPATGREFDPAAGRWIDPVTGQPFGEVTDHASRLAGVGAGPGALAGGAAAAGMGAGMAGMYGGTMPPSMGNTGAGRSQIMGQAARSMGQKAAVAQRFAAAEARQAGGRPFMPPPGAAGQQGRGAGATGAAGARSATAGQGARTPAPPQAGGNQARAGASGMRGGPPVAQSARGFAPPPAASTSQNRGTSTAGKATSNSHGAAAGTKAGTSTPGVTAHGARQVGQAAASARHQLAGGPSPAPENSEKKSEKARQGRPVTAPGSRSVWASDRVASTGVLGEPGGTNEKRG